MNQGTKSNRSSQRHREDPCLLQRSPTISSTEPFTRIALSPRFTACRWSNFAELSATLFIPAAAQKPVYIFSGEVGAWGGNLTRFYQQDAASGATLLATGLGDSPADSLLQVEVTAAGTEVTILPLDVQDFLPLAEHNLKYWEKSQ